MDVKTATDVGQVRDNNEDALWVGSRCLVVCDGMGGHLAGEVASAIAIDVVKEFPFTGNDPEQEILQAIQRAQEQVLQLAGENENYKGMGSTITLAWFNAPMDDGTREMIVGHVGDSRCYVFSHGELEQITSDHSVVGELLRSGTITPLEARIHPKRHILTQVLGSSEIEPELITKKLEPNSLVILCTDGLTDVVDDDLLLETLRNNSHKSPNLAQDLVDLANERGGPDNISVIVAKL